MKDSQQTSVEVSSQNDMALSALSPVSMKESSLYRVDSIVADCLQHLSDNDERATEWKEPDLEIPEAPSQETEDDILNKFDTPEGDEALTNGSAESDDKLEDRLLNDGIDVKVDNEPVNSNHSDLNKSESEECVDIKCEEIPDEAPDLPNDQEQEQEKMETSEASVKSEEESEVVVETEVEGKTEMEKKDEDDRAKQQEDAEKKEKKDKENAELLKDQILDTEDLLQIVDQQDTVDDTNDNSCSGETTPDKEESDDAECNDTETEKNDDDEMTISKNDDDGVDIEEESLYKGDFDSEMDKEYEKIINERDNQESNDRTDDDSTVSEPVKDKEDNVVEVDQTQMDSKMEAESTTIEVTENAPTDESSAEEIQTQNSDHTPSDPTSKSKRSLSESDTAVEAKRIRLEEKDPATEEQPVNKEEKEADRVIEKPAPITHLSAISEYMQRKSLKKLTREDLEQICVLKMCEAICHKSEIGELRHQLSVQEQMVDMWRKEAAQLTKQARDLEIVNKRLLHEVRLKADRDKPLIPVRITRSVGLQVRSDNNVLQSSVVQKRRFVRPQTATTATSQKATTPQSRFNQTKSTPPPPNKPASKSVTATPTKLTTSVKAKSVTPKTPNSLLSKALQNSTAQAVNSASSNTGPTAPPLASITSTPTTTTVPVTTKSATNSSPKTAKPTELPKGVIDLTDEDEKKPTSTTTTTVNTTQGVRIVSAPIKNANSTVSTTGVVNPPRIMYLYNNQLHQGVLATDTTKGGSQKVMFKLNSNVIGQANGVLTTVTNGSSVAVTNGTVRTNQVQSVRFSSPVTTVRTSASSKVVAKHPAPLPPPPMNQLNLAARKPIPPKPHLSIRRSTGGIVLSWKMPYVLDNYEAIASYQLYAYQETTSAPSSDMWRKVGDVKALALPMACTLTQFADGNKYHFAVRAVDVQKRMGPFSDPEHILL